MRFLWPEELNQSTGPERASAMKAKTFAAAVQATWRVRTRFNEDFIGARVLAVDLDPRVQL